jgi:DNA-binding IscR family transcriptional regulator
MQETLTNIGHHLDAKLSHLADVTKAHGQNIGEIAQMQKISAEAVYLANIMSELRDHPCVH